MCSNENVCKQTKQILKYALTSLLVAFVMVSCGKKKEEKPPEQLNIKVFLSSDSSTSDVYRNVINQYAAAHSELIVNSTMESDSLQQIKANPSGYLSNADVIVYPSTYNTVLRSQPSNYYPLSATIAQIPPVVDQAYRNPDTGKLWALPLVADPMIMVLKKNAARVTGDSTPPKTWSKVDMISGINLSNGLAMPHFVFLNKDSLYLADSMAAIQMAVGFYQDSLRGEKIEEKSTEEKRMQTLHQSVTHFRNYFNEEGEPINQLPQVTSLTEFIESDALFTIARHSDYMNLPNEMQNQLFLMIIPTDYEKITIPCHLIVSAVPIQAANHKRGIEFIKFLLDNANVVADGIGGLVIDQTSIKNDANSLLSMDLYLVPRESDLAIGQKSVIDVLNGDFSIKEFTHLWAEGFYLPE